MVILDVIDDGIGFEPTALASKYQIQHGHFGLTNLRERIHALKGQLVMSSQAGQGTHVRAVLPLHPVASMIPLGEHHDA